MAALEELIEGYRAFVANTTLSTPIDRAERRKLLKKTQKVLGPPPDKSPESHSTDGQYVSGSLFENNRRQSISRRERRVLNDLR